MLQLCHILLPRYRYLQISMTHVRVVVQILRILRGPAGGTRAPVSAVTRCTDCRLEPLSRRSSGSRDTCTLLLVLK